jgi:hypothetical protein
MMDDYIYVNNYSISKELCFDIIKLFEKSEDKYPGITGSGLNKDIKDTNDFRINHTDKKWEKIYKFLHNEITINLNKYFKKLNSISDFNNPYQNTKFTFQHFISHNFYYSSIQIQKYKKNTGRYIYHNDSEIDLKENKYRIITFIWYLNDILEGGETFFNGNISIKPETGKLVFFPSTWTYPHCGKIPLSNDKYIMTGWIYTDIN